MKFERKHQAVCAELGDLINAIRLPDGLQWKDFSHEVPQPGKEFWIAEPSLTASGSHSKATPFWNTQIVGIERASDGKVVTIEIVGLDDTGNKAPRLVRMFEFVHQIDVAVGELNA